jgi:signal transduction histidine kinase
VQPEQSLDITRMHRLLQVGRALVAELDPDSVLDLVLETAREITHANYAALGVLDPQRQQLDRFITLGLDEVARDAIGELPRGRGVLGVLIDEPRPLRLSDVGRHPRSFGFPPGHPRMRSFLGVPIMIRGEAWGNVYLAEKLGGEFDASDEEAVLILAEWAAVAIENARLYQVSETRRIELEKALRASEVTRDIATAIGGEVELERVLELIVKRGRALVAARSLVILLRDDDELLVAATAGYAEGARGRRLPISGSPYGQVMDAGRPERVKSVGARLGIDPSQFGVADARSALIVPLAYRSSVVGVLCAFDRGEQGDAFSEDDEQLLRTFAASAATAVVMARSVQEERLHRSLAAADAERRRWARELHDETLQGLAALRVLLSVGLRGDEPQTLEDAALQAIVYIEQEIANLRAIISDLRPAALDELGLLSAIESLVERHRERSRFAVELDTALRAPSARLAPDLETVIYRLLQEALNNAAKHSSADRVQISIEDDRDALVVQVRDDGRGVRPHAEAEGFGLVAMRERVALAGGTLEIESGPGGTLVRARLPVRHAAGTVGEGSLKEARHRA